MLGCCTCLASVRNAGYSGPEMAEAVGLAIRDVFYCCDLVIQQQIIAKKLKNFVNSDVL